jgi:NAD(P)-dependent dehydrogenase (short-subunit alcohol dehydrogenase family)
MTASSNASSESSAWSSNGRTALVTGAAGGIGSAIASQLYEDGYFVVAIDLSQERLQDLALKLPGIKTIVADISGPEGVATVMAEAGDAIDVLCNAAGVSDGGASVEELTDEIWERVLRINLTSIYLMCNRVVTQMVTRGEGVVINLSSAAGLRGGRAGAAYTASKWAIVGMSQNIAASVGVDGVRCHAICPARIEGAIDMGKGVTRTPKGIFRAERDAGRPKSGKPSDVSSLVSFLVSDRAAHLNGMALPVDGGWLAF